VLSLELISELSDGELSDIISENFIISLTRTEL
jgi:hypothetical protein